MKTNYFEGWYLKHQRGNDTMAFIPGRSDDTAFIQIITNNESYNIEYPLTSYRRDESIHIGKCEFSKDGIRVDIDDCIRVHGDISYSGQTPIGYDIMGPFKFFPMECRHGVISMRHNLKGQINVDGKDFDFTNGIGYMEQDSGTSFPKTYTWIQCNNFNEECSIMVSIADIPFMGINFKGCICVVYYRQKEYRLATYLGVKIEHSTERKIVLKQGKYRLAIDIPENKGNKLYAPDKGTMARTIHENASCKAQFRFYIGGKILLDFESNNASFEFVQ